VNHHPVEAAVEEAAVYLAAERAATVVPEDATVAVAEAAEVAREPAAVMVEMAQMESVWSTVGRRM